MRLAGVPDEVDGAAALDGTAPQAGDHLVQGGEATGRPLVGAAGRLRHRPGGLGGGVPVLEPPLVAVGDITRQPARPGSREDSAVSGSPGFGCPEGRSNAPSGAGASVAVGCSRQASGWRSTLMQRRGWTENTGRGPMRALLQISSPTASRRGWQAPRLVLGSRCSCMTLVSNRARRGHAVGAVDGARQPTRQSGVIFRAGSLDVCAILRRSLGIGFSVAVFSGPALDEWFGASVVSLKCAA